MQSASKALMNLLLIKPSFAIIYIKNFNNRPFTPCYKLPLTIIISFTNTSKA